MVEDNTPLSDNEEELQSSNRLESMTEGFYVDLSQLDEDVSSSSDLDDSEDDETESHPIRQRQETRWTYLSSMKLARHRFGSAVVNGKIYVFGGIHGLNRIDEAEMYDPQTDSSPSV